MNFHDLVRAAMAGDDLTARQWVKDARHAHALVPFERPVGLNRDQLATAAALAELFSKRAGLPTPRWVRRAKPAKRPVFLDRDAASYPKIKAWLLEDAPKPLRRRNVFAAAEYLVVLQEPSFSAAGVKGGTGD